MMPGLADAPPGGGAPPLDPPNAQMPGPPSSPDESLALRCAICSIDWPPSPSLFGYDVDANEFFARAKLSETEEEEAALFCPQCGGTTHVAGNLNPISLEEAWRLKNYADFERFYEDRGERDVLTPEELEEYGPVTTGEVPS